MVTQCRAFKTISQGNTYVAMERLTEHLRTKASPERAAISTGEAAAPARPERSPWPLGRPGTALRSREF
jgi:hypothetical protein